MAGPKKGDKKPPKDDDGSGRDDGYEKPPPQPPGNPDASPVRIHRDYVRRRLQGGAAATPEAYARGVEQWTKLPGSVSRPPNEIKGDVAQSVRNKGEGGADSRGDKGGDKEGDKERGS